MVLCTLSSAYMFFVSSRRRHTRGALVTGVQTCALPISELQTAKKTQKIDNGIEAQRRVLGIAADDWAKVHRVLSTRKLLSVKEAGILNIAMQMPSKIPTEKQCAVQIGRAHV